MSVISMICFSRSGGTLLNKCLGCMSNIVMLSEVNPIGGGWGELGANSYITVKAQAKKWFNIDIQSDLFIEAIDELYEKCNKQEKQLLVRDWSFVNFFPVFENNYQPANRLLILDELGKKGKVVAFVYVRDAIDVWISKGMPPIKEFSEHYLHYVNAIIKSGLPVFKYEDFCNNPDNVLKEICREVGVVYDDKWVTKYQEFKFINGDVQLKESRNRIATDIKLLPRKRISIINIFDIYKCNKLHQANKLLGYSSSYYN